MLLKALQDFNHAEDMINTMRRKTGEEFEVENLEHAQRLIEAGLATDAITEEVEAKQSIQDSEIVEEKPKRSKKDDE